jgi:NTP pyrophosphatase (non-canonical NTP hydrolase)
MSKVNEILDILQEECAEVIQSVSKCRRFGLNNRYLNGAGTQRDELVKEIGDVVAMIELLMEHGVVTDAEIDLAKQNKFNKLRKWSTIFDEQD